MGECFSGVAGAGEKETPIILKHLLHFIIIFMLIFLQQEILIFRTRNGMGEHFFFFQAGIQHVLLPHVLHDEAFPSEYEILVMLFMKGVSGRDFMSDGSREK